MERATGLCLVNRGTYLLSTRKCTRVSRSHYLEDCICTTEGVLQALDPFKRDIPSTKAMIRFRGALCPSAAVKKSPPFFCSERDVAEMKPSS